MSSSSRQLLKEDPLEWSAQKKTVRTLEVDNNFHEAYCNKGTSKKVFAAEAASY